jgi:hypothetical protein
MEGGKTVSFLSGGTKSCFVSNRETTWTFFKLSHGTHAIETILKRESTLDFIIAKQRPVFSSFTYTIFSTTSFASSSEVTFGEKKLHAEKNYCH